MDVPFIEGSNTLALVAWILGLHGSTFEEKCIRAIERLEARKECSEDKIERERLLRANGQVRGFIRHEQEPPFDWQEVRLSAAA